MIEDLQIQQVVLNECAEKGWPCHNEKNRNFTASDEKSHLEGSTISIKSWSCKVCSTGRNSKRVRTHVVDEFYISCRNSCCFWLLPPSGFEPGTPRLVVLTHKGRLIWGGWGEDINQYATLPVVSDILVLILG